MKRPEKIKVNELPLNIYGTLIYETRDKNFAMFGHNSCCDDHDKFLPDEKEIADIIYDATQYLPFPGKDVARLNAKLEKVFAKRLGVK